MPPQHWQSATARELCQITGTHDPHSAVQQLAQALLEDAEVAVPPVNLLLIGSFQKIRDIQEAVMPHAGRLLPDGADYLIQVNAHHSRGKQRFTAGHEIGHTLIPSFQRHPHVIQDMVTGYSKRDRRKNIFVILPQPNSFSLSVFFVPWQWT